MNTLLFVTIALNITLFPLVYLAGYSTGKLHGLDLALEIDREVSEFERDLTR